MISKSAPLPVIDPPIPVLTIPPVLFKTLQSATEPLSSAISTLNTSCENSINLLRFKRPNVLASPSAYRCDYFLLGCLPTKYDGNVSVTVSDLPCRGGISIMI